ncbi:MAG: DUF58 domain-containing protein [Pirellulales bacterium]
MSTTLGSKRFLPPEAIARIARLELRARVVVEGVLSGLHKSPYKGQSVEFLQHREYTKGDDLRRVDWKVWARQDRYYVKEFEEETNLRLFLVVDTSRSMSYSHGTAARPALSKFDYAATMAASLAWLALSHSDAVGCATFDNAVRETVPPRTRRTQLQGVIEMLEAKPSNNPSAFLPVFRQLAETLPKRGLVVLISDLLGDASGGGDAAGAENILKGLSMLRRRGHDVAVLHVMDSDELDFPFDGPTRFEGLELPQHIACNPRALREGYLQAVEEFLSAIRRGCAGMRCDYSLVRTDQPVDASLIRFLSQRASMAV